MSLINNRNEESLPEFKEKKFEFFANSFFIEVTK